MQHTPIFSAVLAVADAPFTRCSDRAVVRGLDLVSGSGCASRAVMSDLLSASSM
jgi:hypothetical protein